MTDEEYMREAISLAEKGISLSDNEKQKAKEHYAEYADQSKNH